MQHAVKSRPPTTHETIPTSDEIHFAWFLPTTHATRQQIRPVLFDGDQHRIPDRKSLSDSFLSMEPMYAALFPLTITRSYFARLPPSCTSRVKQPLPCGQDAYIQSQHTKQSGSNSDPLDCLHAGTQIECFARTPSPPRPSLYRPMSSKKESIFPNVAYESGWHTAAFLRPEDEPMPRSLQGGREPFPSTATPRYKTKKSASLSCPEALSTRCIGETGHKEGLRHSTTFPSTFRMDCTDRSTNPGSTGRDGLPSRWGTVEEAYH
jgi:hypothetical protein